jgi:drug/metabolite transporter (DMT)-like permease
MIFLTDAIDSMAQLCMKKGLAQTGINSITLNNVAEFLSRNLFSTMVWLGLFLYIASFVIWMIILYCIDLSVAIPIGSMAYIFIPIIAIIFFKEHVGLLRWFGIAFIMFGIRFISQSVKQKEAENPV